MINTQDNQEKIIPIFIKNAIENEIKKAVDQELEEAKNRIEKRKLEIVAYVMISVDKYMIMEKFQDNYRFTIDIKSK